MSTEKPDIQMAGGTVLPQKTKPLEVLGRAGYFADEATAVVEDAP